MSDFVTADLIVLVLIAVFVGLRLRNTLGKQVGFDPREKRDALRRSMQADAAATAEDGAGVVIEGQKVPADAVLDAMPEGSVRTMLESLRLQEPSFTTAAFLDGAKGAFEWVFNAYHKGDRATLKGLLAADVYAEFDAAIAAREAANQRSKGTLVAIEEATITDVQIEKRNVTITVRFVSEQVLVMTDAEGAVIEGDASAVVRVDDEWSFARQIGARSPNWTVTNT